MGSRGPNRMVVGFTTTCAISPLKFKILQNHLLLNWKCPSCHPYLKKIIFYFRFKIELNVVWLVGLWCWMPLSTMADSCNGEGNRSTQRPVTTDLSYGGWIYNYLCNITTKVVSLNPVHGEVYLIQHYVIKFVSDLWQVCCDRSLGHTLSQALSWTI
jgi:hypothetical protein